MEKPLITVYITNYNYGNYLAEAVESVLNQSCQGFELIIVDDGSTDNSIEIIESYKDLDRIKIIYQKNKGLNVTNNIAMRSAQGKYLVRLDADDFLHPEALEIMSSTLENDESLGLVFPDYYYVDEQGTKIGEERRHNFEKEVSLFDQPAHGACTMVRLNWLKDLGGYNESFNCQDGYDLWLKFILHHKVSNINRPLFYYRRHGNNLTNNEERILSTRKRIKDYYVDHHEISTPKTVAILPIRSELISGESLPLFQLPDGESVLEKVALEAATARKVDLLVITSAEDQLIQEAFKIKHEKILVLKRPKEYARLNEPLTKTIQLVVDEVRANHFHPEAILSLSIEYPFISSDYIDDAINTISVFEANSVLSVRPDNKMYYQHDGSGLKPLLDQMKFTKLEREALYKAAGGIVASTIENFEKTGKLVGGKVSNIVVDQKTAHGIFSEFDFQVYKTLIATDKKNQLKHV